MLLTYWEKGYVKTEGVKWRGCLGQELVGYSLPRRGSTGGMIDKWGVIQGTHSNCIFKFPVFPCLFPVRPQIVTAPIYMICDYYIHKTELEIFATNIETSFTFRIREFTT